MSTDPRGSTVSGAGLVVGAMGTATDQEVLGPAEASEPVAAPLDTAPRPPRTVPSWVTIAALVLGSMALSVLGIWGAAAVAVAVLASVAAHELAHLGVARALGVRAQEFFVGFGPRLWSFRRAGTEWGVKAVPLGGYVKLVDGESAPAWRRCLIALAGPVANLAVALLLIVGIAVSGGLATATGTTSQLPFDERVTAGVERFVDATVASVEPVVKLPGAVGSMGRAVLLGDQLPAAEHRLVSPIGIGRLADQAAGEGWVAAVTLVAVVNLALGLFNLVPLPPFDGGRVAAVGLESIIGRARHRRVVLTGRGFERLGLVVVGVLLFALATATVLDVLHPLENPFVG